MIQQKLKTRKRINHIYNWIYRSVRISKKTGFLLLLGIAIIGGNLCYTTQKSPAQIEKEIITRSDNMTQGKSLYGILSPAKDTGNRFLFLDHLMWHYVPKMGHTMKISPYDILINRCLFRPGR